MKIIAGKLHAKVFLAMAGASLVPIAAAGIFSLANVYSSQKANIAQIEEGVLRQKIEEARSFIANIAGVLDIRVSYEQTAAIAPEDQRFILEKMMNENPPLLEASFVNVLPRNAADIPEGRETYRLRRGITDSPLRTLSRMSWYKEIVEQKKTYIGEIENTLSGPVISMASPVLNKNGSVVALLFARVSFQSIAEKIVEATIGKQGYVYAVDAQGGTIGPYAPMGVEPRAVTLPIVEQALLGRESIGAAALSRYASPFGENVAASAIPLKISDDISLAVVAEWPVAEADAIMNTLARSISLFTFGAIVLALLISALVAGAIVRPIRTLEESTHLVAQGNFDSKISVTTGDELQELAESFTKMTDGLRELQQLKDEFVFIAAHELRTPVAAIKGYLQLIAQGLAGKDPASLKEYIGKITDANLRLVRLVDDLLEVARSDAGKLTIDVAPIAIGESIRSVIGELAPLAKEKNIEVAYETGEGEVPLVEADAGRVKEVLVNLMGNAIKYMGRESGAILITHTVNAGMLETRVEDTGMGMSKEESDKLFQKFYRVANEKTRGITGTGLGLFIVKQIVEKMRGTIRVESEPGQGSAFTFTLPLA